MAVPMEMNATTWTLGKLMGSTLVLATALGAVGPRLGSSGTNAPAAQADRVLAEDESEAPMAFRPVDAAPSSGGTLEDLGVQSGAGDRGASLGGYAGSPAEDVYLAVADGSGAAGSEESACGSSTETEDRWEDFRRRLEAYIEELKTKLEAAKKKVEDLKGRIADGEEGLEDDLDNAEFLVWMYQDSLTTMQALLEATP